jgi:hypothetical protein
VLRGGRGSDGYLGGTGDDDVDARDGAFDAVACGPGADVVRLDDVDLAGSCRILERVGPAVPLVDGVAEAGESVVAVAIACPVDMPGDCEGRFRISVGGRIYAARAFDVNRGRIETLRLRLGRRAVNRLVAGRGNVTVASEDARGRSITFRDSLGRDYLIDAD